MAEGPMHAAVALVRDALARRGIAVDEAALHGGAAYLADVLRNVESLRELEIAPLTPPAHCHADAP